MVKTTNGAGAEELAAADAVRKRAARQAAKQELAPQAVPTVTCTVLPQGHDKISMGQHVSGLGEAHYEEGETFTIGLPIAIRLYARGFVNFEGARAALEAERERVSAEVRQSAAEKAAMDKALESAGL